MRAAEREVNEIEKKKQVIEQLAVTNGKPKETVVDVSKTKLDSILKEIKAESLRLAQARIQLQNLKTGPKPTKGEKSAAGGAAVKDDSAAGGKSSGANGDAAGGAGKSSSAKASSVDAAFKTGGPKSVQVPNSVLPELCR